MAGSKKTKNMTEHPIQSDHELNGWQQAVEDTSQYPELHAIAKHHLERVEAKFEISPEHHQAHIDIARPTVPNIDSLPQEEQDFIGEVIEIGEEALGSSIDIDEPIEEINILHLSPEALKENAANYPQMAYEVDPLNLEKVRDALLKLPLFHATESRRFSAGGDRATPDTPISQGAADRLGLYDALTEKRKFRSPSLNKQLNLDEYVFMSWGQPVHGRFSREAHAVMIDPSILLDEGCIVTPASLVKTTPITNRGLLDNGVSAEANVNIIREEYVSKVVTGKDWLEIMAREITYRFESGKGEPLQVHRMSDLLGEIKYPGQIPRSKVMGVMGFGKELVAWQGEVNKIVDDLNLALGYVNPFFQEPIY